MTGFEHATVAARTAAAEGAAHRAQLRAAARAARRRQPPTGIRLRTAGLLRRLAGRLDHQPPFERAA